MTREVTEALHHQNRWVRRHNTFKKWLGFLFFNISMILWCAHIFTGNITYLSYGFIFMQWAWLAEVLYRRIRNKFHAAIDFADVNEDSIEVITFFNQRDQAYTVQVNDQIINHEKAKFVKDICTNYQKK